MKKYSIIFALIAGIFSGCTNLETLPYNELTLDKFYEDRTQVLSAVLLPYGYARAWAIPQTTGWWRAMEMSADQLAWPQKGRHGYDGGDHGRYHYHSWTVATTDNCSWTPWTELYQGVGYCNNVISDLEALDFNKIPGVTLAEKDAWIIEIKAVRAWHYVRLLELFGNIPIVTEIATSPTNPEQTPMFEVFKWIESELLAVVDKLPNLSNTQRGRMTKAGVYAILVDMYLNAEVWSGQARWDDCITYANKLINNEAGGLNGAIQLDADIDITYSNTNATRSREAIFQLAMNRNSTHWFNRDDLGTYVERDILNQNYGGNNGIVVVPGVMETYSDKDLRRYSWFLYGIGSGYGPYTAGGSHGRHYMGPYKNLGSRYPGQEYCIGTEEFLGRPLVYLNKPVKAVIEVSGTSTTPIASRVITIKEWYCPEFPGDEAKLLMEAAYNAAPTKSQLITAYDNGEKEVYNSGAYNAGRPANQYSWSRMNDYRFMWQDCAENTGARFNKYKTGPITDSNNGNNDVILYRLTDAYFAKAEALMRKNGNSATQEAVDLINACKKRAFLAEYWDSQEAIDKGDRYTTATLTMDELLRERGREFIFEGKRRNDIIRFDKWEFAIPGWWDANAGYEDGSAGSINKDKSRRLFNIPGRAGENNPSLVQNPGYPPFQR